MAGLRPAMVVFADTSAVPGSLEVLAEVVCTNSVLGLLDLQSFTANNFYERVQVSFAVVMNGVTSILFSFVTTLESFLD